MPSELVAHAPASPTTQNCDPAQTIDRAAFVPKDVLDNPERYVHVIPSGLVAHAPLLPTAQNCEPFHVNEFAWLVNPALANPGWYVQIAPGAECSDVLAANISSSTHQ